MKLIAYISLFVGLVSMNAYSVTIQDNYDFVMQLKVPAVVDNMQSRGKRVYKRQKVKGTLHITYKDGEYPVITITGLYNLNYKISGRYVTYSTTVDDSVTKVNYIGSNASNKFKTPTISFSLDADPSYNVGEDEPDNTLVLVCSGYGTSAVKSSANGARVISKVRGYASGQLGCGCRAYGHVSPTRSASANGANLSSVEDISAIYGSWYIKWKSRTYLK